MTLVNMLVTSSDRREAISIFRANRVAHNLPRGVGGGNFAVLQAKRHILEISTPRENPTQETMSRMAHIPRIRWVTMVDFSLYCSSFQIF